MSQAMRQPANEKDVFECFSVCEFSLPILRRSGQPQDPIDSDGLQPAPEELPNPQASAESSQKGDLQSKLSLLHSAYSQAVESCADEVQKFEENIEKAKLELLEQFTRSVNELKARVHEVKEAYLSQLHSAIEEISEHWQEEGWSPSGQSLAKVIWNCEENAATPSLLLRLKAQRERNSTALRISLESGVESLWNLSRAFESEAWKDSATHAPAAYYPQDQSTDTSALESSPFRPDSGESIDLKPVETDSEVQRLKSELLALTMNHELQVAELTHDVEMFKQGVAKVAANYQDQIARIKEQYDNRIFYQSQEIYAFRNQPSIIETCLSSAYSLQGTGKYEESEELMKAAWTVMKRAVSGQKGGASLAYALAQLSSLRFGRFEEANRLIEEVLLDECKVEVTPGEAHRLLNLKAAIQLHSGKDAACELVCKSIFAAVDFEQRADDDVWETLFYYSLACCQQCNQAKADELSRGKRCSTPSSKFFQCCTRGKIASCRKVLHFAEECFQEALGVASAAFPDSIHAALVLHFFGSLCADEGRREEAKAKLLAAEAIFSAKFPASIYAALNLSCLANLQRENEDIESSIELYGKVLSLFEKYHPTDISYAISLIDLASIYRDTGKSDQALEYRKKADSVLRSHFPSEPITAINISQIGLLLSESEQLGDAEECLLQAKDLFVAHYPTSNFAAANSFYLGEVCAKVGKREDALLHAKAAHALWRKNDSICADTKAQPLLERLRNSS